MNILVRSPNWIGDQILAYPFFHFLRRGFPRARIVVSCSPWTQPVQFENLVDEIVPLPRVREPGFWSRFQALEEAAAKLKASGPMSSELRFRIRFHRRGSSFARECSERIGYSTRREGISPESQRKRWDPEKIGHRAEAYVKLLPESRQASPQVQPDRVLGSSARERARSGSSVGREVRTEESLGFFASPCSAGGRSLLGACPRFDRGVEALARGEFRQPRAQNRR